MTKRITPLLEDPTSPLDVRELLQAGRDAQVTDYDYGAGLDRHVALVQTGAPLPDWAKGLEGGAGHGAAAAAAGTGLLGWLALPVVTAAVIAAVVMMRQPEPSASPQASDGAGAGRTSDAVANVERHAQKPAVAAPAVVPQGSAVAAPDDESAAVDAPRRAARGRASSAAKPAAGKRVSGVAAGARTGGSSDSSGTGANRTGSQDLFARAPGTEGGGAQRAESTGAANAAHAARVQPQTQAQPGAAEQPSEERAEQQPQAPAPIDDNRLEREMGMLAVAQRVLQVDPARTLALSRQGESEFAGSMFTPERKQLELLALVKLGRLDEAKRLARPYLARYPNGPFSDRVRRALATGRVER